MPIHRPPPLALSHDNMSSNPGKFAAPRRPAQTHVLHEPGPLKEFWNEIYQADWKNLVIAVAGMNAIRFLIHATTSFTNGEADKIFHAPKLAHVSCVLGVLYLIIAVIQVFGVFGIITKRLILIRTYVYLSSLSALLMVVAGFTSGVTFFILSDDLIHECVTLAVVGSLQTKSLFKGKAFKWSNPTPSIAKTHCIAAWGRSSVSQVLSIFLFSVFPAILFFLLGFVYYRQVTDPEHTANLLGYKPKATANPPPVPDTRRSHQPAVPAIHINGTPVDPDFAAGSRGLARPIKGKGRDRISIKQKRNTMSMERSLSRTPSSNSPYAISPGPPSYEDVTREARLGFGYGYQAAADSRVSVGRSGIELRGSSIRLV